MLLLLLLLLLLLVLRSWLFRSSVLVAAADVTVFPAVDVVAAAITATATAVVSL